MTSRCGLCEMVKACQEKREPFYITAEEEDCVGKKFLGLPGSSKYAELPGRRTAGRQSGRLAETGGQPQASDLLSPHGTWLGTLRALYATG